MATQDTETDNPAPVKPEGEEEAGGDNEVGDGGGDAAPVPDGTAIENPSATNASNPLEVKIENGESGAVATAGADGGGVSNAAAADGGTGGDKGDDSKADVEDDAPKTFPQVVRTVSLSEVLYSNFFLSDRKSTEK